MSRWEWKWIIKKVKTETKLRKSWNKNAIWKVEDKNETEIFSEIILCLVFILTFSEPRFYFQFSEVTFLSETTSIGISGFSSNFSSVTNVHFQPPNIFGMWSWPFSNLPNGPKTPKLSKTVYSRYFFIMLSKYFNLHRIDIVWPRVNPLKAS